MRTLYITDLDGTLLRSDGSLSKFTASAVNSLIGKGMVFSYATARSYVSASRVTAGLCESLPVIIFNGTFILDFSTGRMLRSCYFSAEEARSIVEALTDGGVYPFVHRMTDEGEEFDYIEERLSRGAAAFAEERRSDPRRRPVNGPDGLAGEGIFHFTCIDERERLAPLYEALRERFECVFYLDPYSREYWLEVQPRGATKAEAVLYLKDALGCDRVVCFGDGVNDLSMFEVSDECYAVESACEEVKKRATAVIGSNDEDGVAKWLLEKYIGEK